MNILPIPRRNVATMRSMHLTPTLTLHRLELNKYLLLSSGRYKLSEAILILLQITREDHK